MSLSLSRIRRSILRGSIFLCLTALLQLLAPASALAFLKEPTVIPLLGQQSAPVFIDGGIVFEHQAGDDQPADLWVSSLSAGGTRSAIATGLANQHSAASFGRFVVFVSEEQRVDQITTFRMDVVDATSPSRRATLVPATTTPLWSPSIRSGVLAWAQGSTGERDIYGIRIDRDGNAVPDILDSHTEPEIVPLAVDGREGIDLFSPALGVDRLVFASRDGENANARIISMPFSAGSTALVDPSFATTLSADTLNKEPEPATAGNLAVWRHASERVRIYNFTNETSTDVTSGPGWSMIVSPSTDGTHVAWQAFGAMPGTQGAVSHQIFMRDVTGAVFRVSPVSANQFVPAFGSGRLAWGDSRRTQTGQTPNLAHVCLASRQVQGVDRFATAVRSSELAFPGGSQYVLIATGRNWPDALGGSALAGVLDAPILLVEQETIPRSTKDEISRLGATKAIILGEMGVVGTDVESDLRGMGLSVERIGGKDRYATAERIASRVILRLGPGYDGTVFVATGRDFPDALSAAPIAVRQKWPLLLIDPASQNLVENTRAMMARVNASSVIILGGESAVPRVVKDEAVRLLGRDNVRRLEGINRYETAVRVSNFAVNGGLTKQGHVWNRVGIATGENFPDALSGGVLQGRSGSVMLLTPPQALHSAPVEALKGNASAIDTVVFFGGTGALSQNVRDSALSNVR